MFSFIDYFKAIFLAVVIAAFAALYYNYKLLKTDIILLKSEKEKLVQINKDSQLAIDKLQQDLEKNSKTVTKNTIKKQQITKKNKDIKEEIKKLSEIQDDREYEKMINEKYREVTRCITGSC